jgi:DNA (cytosine-5)-methyltransferase 1
MDYLTVKETSEQLGYTEQYIRKLIRLQKIPAERVGKIWLIHAEGLEESEIKGTLMEKTSNHKRVSTSTKNNIALSFFSGAMGLDLGIEKAGFNVVLASEIEKNARATIVENKPEIALIGDIRDYSASDIRTYANLAAKDDIDLVMGGPPCQAFSTAGKRMGFEDERGNIFLTFISRILELRPKYAVIENVRGLLSSPLNHRPHNKRGVGYPPLTPRENKGGALYHILNILSEAGYAVSFNLYNAANFGAPQKRERVILICSRDGVKPPYLEPTHAEDGNYGLHPWKTVREALSGLNEKYQKYVKFPENRLKYYRMIGPGQYWKHLPEKLHKEALGASFFAGGGKTGFIRRVPWDAPSPTLVTNPVMPATDLGHPEKDRPLSIQEYKRLQEFPDDWIICGSIANQYKQIGNAVPISLGFAVGNHLMKLMKGDEIKVIKDFPYSRYKSTDDQSWRMALESIKDDAQIDLALSC